MARYELAHIREQGQDMLIFPLNRAVHNETDAEKAEILDGLELAARQAGLAGSAVIVWEHGGRMQFMGPAPWHPFLRGINMRWVRANLNRWISW